MDSEERTWYHGTSTESGLDVDDYLDPTRGSFESCVWATSSIEEAMSYARDAAVVLGGEPVVYRLEVVGELAQCDDGEIDYDADVDAIVDTVGEHGVPMLAILSKLTARVVEVV